MRIALYILLAVALSLLMTGCGSENTSPEKLDDEEFGGLMPTDENPAFGDGELLTLFPEDPPYQDPLINHPDIRNAERYGGSRHYLVRVLWGNLETPIAASEGKSDCPVTNWSGSIEVEGGVLCVARLLRFEGGDTVVPYRKSAREFSWTSYTSQDVDGIIFRVIDTPDPKYVKYSNTLRFETKLYQVEIPFSELADYSDFVFIDECNKISIIATAIHPSRCSGGFLEGLWTAESDTSGYFKGVWIADDGTISGHLRGKYDLANGKRVLYGKWIDDSGKFGGLLKGTWTPLPEDLPGPDGLFEGIWVDSTYTVAGSFKGHYCFCESSEQGWFHGRWRTRCK